ncbi:MAG: hypothetical protein PHE73_03610 [Sulfurovaceae bacterium]|nr:hypothetical protein [Sulfurovaceae bacterium]
MGEIENTMSSGEYLEWHEYYKIEPFMADRNELQMAMLSSAMAMGKTKVGDFIISNKALKTNKNRDISTASAADINKLAGV